MRTENQGCDSPFDVPIANIVGSTYSMLLISAPTLKLFFGLFAKHATSAIVSVPRTALQDRTHASGSSILTNTTSPCCPEATTAHSRPSLDIAMWLMFASDRRHGRTAN